MMNGAVSHANQPRIYSSSNEFCRGWDIRQQAGEKTGKQLKIMEPLGKLCNEVGSLSGSMGAHTTTSKGFSEEAFPWLGPEAWFMANNSASQRRKWG